MLSLFLYTKNSDKMLSVFSCEIELKTRNNRLKRAKYHVFNRNMACYARNYISYERNYIC